MISFELSDEQKMIRETVEAFARDRMRPAARAADEDGKIPPEIVQQAWELGLVRGPLPENLGGFGDERSAVTGAIVAEALGYGDLAQALHFLAPRLLAYPVLEMGTPEQQNRFLAGFGTEEFRPATAALSEPRFDFDPFSVATSAVRRGGDYVLNGEKCCVPLARESETILVYAAEGAEAPVRAFLLARDTPGLTLSEPEKNMGIKALATYRLGLKDCVAGPELMLGEGAEIDYLRLLSQAKVAIAGLAVGVARAAFEYARDYAKERRAFGVPIATKQAIAFMLAEMAIEIDCARLLTWEAAWRLDRKQEALKASYLAKNYAANAVLKVADNAVQVLGGHGYIREHPVEMYLRNGRGFSSFEGIATV